MEVVTTFLQRFPRNLKKVAWCICCWITFQSQIIHSNRGKYLLLFLFSEKWNILITSTRGSTKVLDDGIEHAAGPIVRYIPDPKEDEWTTTSPTTTSPSSNCQYNNERMERYNRSLWCERRINHGCPTSRRIYSREENIVEKRVKKASHIPYQVRRKIETNIDTEQRLFYKYTLGFTI